MFKNVTLISCGKNDRLQAPDFALIELVWRFVAMTSSNSQSPLRNHQCAFGDWHVIIEVSQG